jgi:hypothetical protein
MFLQQQHEKTNKQTVGNPFYKRTYISYSGAHMKHFANRPQLDILLAVAVCNPSLLHPSAIRNHFSKEAIMRCLGGKN